MSTVMLNVIMWSGVMPYFFMLRVVMLNVILPSVVAPTTHKGLKKLTYSAAILIT